MNKFAIRGGSWLHVAGDCRSAYRSGRVPSFRFHYLGFRLIQENRNEKIS